MCKFNVESDVYVRYECYQSCGNGKNSPGVMYFYDDSAMSSMMIPKRLEPRMKGIEKGNTILLRSIVKGSENFVSTCWTNILRIPIDILHIPAIP